MMRISRSTDSSVSRLAVVAYHCSPLLEPGSGDAGGMTVYVRSLAEALARRGIWTDVYTRASSDAPRVTELSAGVRVVGIEAGPLESVVKHRLVGYIPDFVAGTRAFALTQRLGYDIVHSHYWQAGMASVQLSRAWGTPLVHSNHTLARVKNGALAPGDRPEPPERIHGETAVMAAADVLVASTDQEYEQMACLYGASHDRLKTLPPGVDHRRFSPGDRAAARATTGLPEDDEIILFVGRIQRLKGIDLAIESLARMARDPGPVLVVVGGPSGPSGEMELEELQRLARDRGVADRVMFVGPQEHARLPDFYRAADLLVLCSHSESFGLVALEAQACGLPVVGTPVGGLSHVVRDGRSGFLIEARDPDLFADRLTKVLEDEGLRRHFSAEAVRSASRLSWDSAAAAFLELYECLVSEGLPEACTC